MTKSISEETRSAILDAAWDLMARHRDTKGGDVERMRTIAFGPGADAATLHHFVDAWLAYLPEVYPVAIQLETSSLADPDAAVAWQDRIFGQGLRLGLDLILARMASAGALAPGHHPARVADLCVTLLVPSTWRYLVVERGWSAAAFVASRHALLQAVLDAPAGPSGDGARASGTGNAARPDARSRGRRR